MGGHNRAARSATKQGHRITVRRCLLAALTPADRASKYAQEAL
jgi:hypothetical protein